VQDERSVGGRSFNGPDRAPKTFTTGRICDEQDCFTQLSIYNQSRYCSLHESLYGTNDMRHRRRKKAA